MKGLTNKVGKNQKRVKMKKRFRTADFFAGVGGIRKGFEKEGFRTVFANDIDQKCKNTYDLNFNNPKLNIEDIWKLDLGVIPDFDLFLGGFPCQAFSIAGHRRGLKDESTGGNLFFRIVKILDVKKPEVLMLENVKNLRSHDKGRTFKVIKEELRDLGYHIRTDVLNSRTHGDIPQNRERIFIVGFKKEEMANAFSFPKEIPLTKKFREFVREKAGKKYYYNAKPLYKKIKGDVNSEDYVYQWRRKYVRVNKRGVVPTLTANMGRGGHNVPIIKNSKGIRKLTPRECFMLQGFHKNFKLPRELSDSRLYHQAGNSVTVPVVQRIAKNIMVVLKGGRINPQKQLF